MIRSTTTEELVRQEFEQRVVNTLKCCQQRNEPPLVWAFELSKCCAAAQFSTTTATHDHHHHRQQQKGEGIISVVGPCELGEVVVSQLCFSNNHPSFWKFLNHALSSRFLYPPHVLSLLTFRVIPHRQSQPEAYRLYIELLSRYVFSFDPLGSDACKEKMLKSIDVNLLLSKTYEVQIFELGHALVLYFFSILNTIIDSLLEDWGLQVTSVDEVGATIPSENRQNMDIDIKGNQICTANEHREQMRRKNSFMALEALVNIMDNRKALILLRLVHLNLSAKFNGLLQRMQFLEAHKLSSPSLRSANELLSKLFSNIWKVFVSDLHLNKRQLIGMLADMGTTKPALYGIAGAGQFACWVAFDICMENAMDGKQFPVTSAIDILTEMINTLQVFNGASWQETFLAFWLSALRLVQRERDPLEGPIPHLEARLCVLLSIAPLAIARVLDCDSTVHSSSLSEGTVSTFMDGGNGHGRTIISPGSKREGLISSLQLLGQYPSLLSPPASVVNAANSAAAKAASFISSTKNKNDGMKGIGSSDPCVKAGGDMRHLIVEACIARKLIDTSAYLWPGYVSAPMISLSDPSSLQKSPWSAFLEGAPLTGPLVNALITNPASSFAEIEKLYHLALNGSEEEKSAAAKILCGASLSRGWNIQEHVVNLVVKLLSPPVPPNFTGSRSHLVDHMPMLAPILFGATSVDTVHILSLHGVLPEIAASLMPLCEAFGSLVPTLSQKSAASDESSVYMVFSSAFLFLLRLWKFYRPPLEQCITGRGGALGSELNLEYLLLLRNSRIQSHDAAAQGEIHNNLGTHRSISSRPIYIDYYPKLRAWYCQNKSCIASTLSGLCSGNPVHQVATKILNMIYWKMTRSGNISCSSSTSSGSCISGPTSTSGEDSCQRPMLPAWEILEAIPFVLEAILTACAHGRLSSRDLTTGLRDLVDFLPASLAAIISYFSAEVTRGIWKPVQMNGVDWPSPAASLVSIESEMKETLGAVGVNIPSSSPGASPAMLPLPLAALASLTITFKLDKNLEYIHAVAGLALENCASGCPWPSMPIVGSLWAQKVRRWLDFIVGSCSLSVFRENQEAVAQLLRSCFSSFLGSIDLSTAPLTCQTGVNGLLGTSISARGLQPPVAPGFLYLRSCRSNHHFQYVNNVTLELVVEFSRDLAAKWAITDFPRLKSARASLAVATARAKEVATLGASLLCVAGGLPLVQELYQETVPTWLLSAREEKHGEQSSAVSRIVEGYAMAYLVVLSGAQIWGVGSKQPSWALSRRSHVVGVHMDFVAGVLDGNISLGCDPATWKAYVSCLVGLLVSFVPIWIQDVKQETLRKLANGLRGWHECQLALSLLERGGIAAMGSVAELLNVI